MPKDFINDPTHWRNRAAETRELAKRVHDKEARKRLSNLATEIRPHRFARRRPDGQAE
jgi:hypothetical protein